MTKSNQKSNRRLALYLVLASALFLVVGVSGFLLFLRWNYPIQTEALLTRIQLWRGEVEYRNPHLSDEMGGHFLNRCLDPSSKAPSRECYCVGFLPELGEDSLSWKRLFLDEADRWKTPVKLFALDLPGTGRSPRPTSRDGYEVRKLAEVARRSLQRECSQWILVGNGFGGWVASWLAMDHPELIHSLILMSPVGIRGDESLSFQPMKEWEALFKDPTAEKLRVFHREAFAQSEEPSESQIQSAAIALKQSPAALIFNAQKSHSYLDGKLAALTRPVMILWGRSDRWTPLEYARIWESMLSTPIYREIGECGHMPQLECPRVLIEAVEQMTRYGTI